MNPIMPGLPVYHHLPEFTQTQSIESVMPSSHLILCRPLFLLPPIPPSIRVFSNESTLHMRWPKYWRFSFSIIPSKEHPGLLSFRVDWLDLIAVQGILKSLVQHHSSKASILLHLAFFIVQFSHPYSSKVAQSCPTLCYPMDCSLPGSSVHGIFSSTPMGCHFLLRCMKVKIESEVAQSCPTLSYTMDYSLPGSSAHGIFQARVLEWGAIAFSKESSDILYTCM